MVALSKFIFVPYWGFRSPKLDILVGKICILPIFWSLDEVVGDLRIHIRPYVRPYVTRLLENRSLLFGKLCS